MTSLILMSFWCYYCYKNASYVLLVFALRCISNYMYLNFWQVLHTLILLKSSCGSCAHIESWSHPTCDITWICVLKSYCNTCHVKRFGDWADEIMLYKYPEYPVIICWVAEIFAVSGIIPHPSPSTLSFPSGFLPPHFELYSSIWHTHAVVYLGMYVLLSLSHALLFPPPHSIGGPSGALHQERLQWHHCHSVSHQMHKSISGGIIYWKWLCNVWNISEASGCGHS